MKNHIPNILTAFNLILGWMTIYFAFLGNISFSFFFILLASIFDFADGFIARKLNVQSKFGAQFDSLADFITFGIAPAIVIYNVVGLKIISIYIEKELSFLGFLFIGLIPLFAAIRLAKFNTIIEKKSYFEGLPSPTFALIAITSSYLYIDYNLETFNKDIYFIFFIIFLSSLMVTKFKFLSLKLIDLKFKNNKLVFILSFFSLTICVILIILGNAIFILPIILLLYLLFSIIYNFIK